MSEFTHIVRFLEVTPHEVRLAASSKHEALAIARHYAETLAPSERKRTFIIADTRYDQFEVEELLKRFCVTLETKAIYEIDLNAATKADAEQRANAIWTDCAPQEFEIRDFMDVRIEGEEVRP